MRMRQSEAGAVQSSLDLTAPPAAGASRVATTATAASTSRLHTTAYRLLFFMAAFLRSSRTRSGQHAALVRELIARTSTRDRPSGDRTPPIPRPHGQADDRTSEYAVRLPIDREPPSQDVRVTPHLEPSPGPVDTR